MTHIFLIKYELIIMIIIIITKSKQVGKVDESY